MRSAVHALTLWVAAVAALKIKSVTHSGPGCDQDTSIKWYGDGTDITIQLLGFGETVGTSQTTNCEVHIILDGGNPGQKLVLNEVDVSGTLTLSSGAQADFYTSAFWSENASDQVTKQSTKKAVAASSDKVSINSRPGVASECVEKDGYVGILNVNFRVASDTGKVTLGPLRGVTEHLGLSWKSC